MTEGRREPALSAQVILSRREAAPEVAAFFRDAGFEPGAMVGTSFAISGGAAVFQATFGDAASALASDGPAELPTSALPAEVAAAIETIAVSGAPDFGLGAG